MAFEVDVRGSENDGGAPADDDAESPASDRRSRPRLVPCPSCGIPTRLPEPVHLVEFPGDVATVERVMSGQFNTSTHFCGARTSLLAPVVAVWASKKRAITVAASKEVLGPLPEGWEVTEAPAYQELRKAMTEWLTEEANALLTEVMDSDFAQLDREAKIAITTPLRLLAWTLELEGSRRVAVTPADRKRVDSLSRLHVAVLTDHLRALALQAGLDDVPGELLDILAGAVPSRCLTSEVLDALASDCEDSFHEHLHDRDRMAIAFRREWICAGAHSIAQVENPRRGHWARMLVFFWALSRLEGAQIDERFFLTPAALQATLSFEHLLTAAVRLGLRNGSASIDAFTKFLGQYSGLFERAGFEELFIDWFEESFARGMAAAAPQIEVPQMFASIASGERKTEKGLGRRAAAAAERWTQSFPDRTEEVVEGFADQLEQVGTVEDLCRYVAASTTWLNKRHEWGLAWRLVERIFDDLNFERTDLEPGELADMWNEIGNTFRYVGHSSEALEAYAIAERYSHGLPDEGWRLRVVTRNRAIVLRDSGSYSEAEAEFARLSAEHPDDPELLHSMAVFYDRIGEWEKGLALTDQALASPLLRREQVARFLAHRADFQRELGRDDAALADVRTAWSIVGEQSVDERLRLAAVGARCSPTDGDLREFRTTLVTFILDRAPHFVGTPGSIGPGALAIVAEAALRAGDLTTARTALEVALPEPRSPEATPVGQLAVDWAWLRVLEGDTDDALPWLVHGLLTLEVNVPVGGEATYALSWVRGATEQIDRVLELAPRITDDASLLIAVYETANGRELSANVPDDDETPWGHRLALAAQESRSDIVALLDGTDRLTVILFPATGGSPQVRRVDLSADDLERATTQLGAFDGANPVAPHRVDGRLAGWWHAAGVIAATIRPLLTEGAELVFLPGRRLASSPLHLAGWPTNPLIVERPVSFCPNAHVLLGDEGRAEGIVGVVVVPKASDAEPFVRALHNAGDRVLERAPGGRMIADETADEETVLSLARESVEIAFLCHGVSSSGLGQGPGICVAASGLLPPSPLPIDSDPDLARFALSWSDLSDLGVAPRVVVSMACSTGRSQIGAGGTRIGLEQGLFTQGTAAVVSPLWNIDQEPSLAWLRFFYEAHRPGTTEDLGLAYQSACLRTREQYPHPFAWGPFILTRRLTKEHS